MRGVALILAHFAIPLVPMQIDLFDARMLKPLTAFLQQHGVRAGGFLDRARISDELVEEGGWIGKKQAYDFTFDVVKRTGCHEAVFMAYLAFDLEHLGPIAVAMRACKTVKEALEVGLRLGSTAYEGNEYFLSIDGNTTWICYREPKTISAGQLLINDMTLTVYLQLIRALVDDDWRPERALLRHEVTTRHQAVEHFEFCQASSHPEVTALAIPTEFLSRRLRTGSRGASAESGKPWRFGPEDAQPAIERMYRLLNSSLACRRVPTLGQVAQMVDASEASLKREFAAAGTSYQKILDRLRFDAACEMLAIPQMSVSEIANDLGYSGSNNFVRAFRRMTGMTPSDFRSLQYKP
jgi:AraC-like DNA-binding protein